MNVIRGYIDYGMVAEDTSDGSNFIGKLPNQIFKMACASRYNEIAGQNGWLLKNLVQNDVQGSSLFA